MLLGKGRLDEEALVRLAGLCKEETLCEEVSRMKTLFPLLNLEDKVILKEERYDRENSGNTNVIEDAHLLLELPEPKMALLVAAATITQVDLELRCVKCVHLPFIVQAT